MKPKRNAWAFFLSFYIKNSEYKTMKSFISNFILLFFSFNAIAGEVESCASYDLKLNEIYMAQTNFKVNSKDTVGDFVHQIDFFSDAMNLLTKLNRYLTPTRDILNLETFFQKEYPNVLNPLQNQGIKDLLSVLSSECSNLEDIQKCNEKLDGFRDHSTFEKTKAKIKTAQDNLKVKLDEVYLEPNFNQLTKVARFVAHEKHFVCPDQNENQNDGCGTNGENQLSTLANTTMAAVQHYLENDQKVSEREFYRACKRLEKSEYKLKACASTEKTIVLVKEKKEKNKKTWGPIFKTAGIVTITGGALAGVAYLIADAFKDKSSKSFNGYSNMYSGLTNNTSYYNSGSYNPYQAMYGNGPGYNMFYNPYSSMYNSYQFGYNPYMMGSYYGFMPQAYSYYY